MKQLIPIAVILIVLCSSMDARSQSPTLARIRKPQMSDTIRANVYADNSFMLYINGELVAVDSIAFVPHYVISVDILPSYPMTIAVMAKDNFDPKTGMEYANTNIGDGGFILKFSDRTSEWGKAKEYNEEQIGPKQPYFDSDFEGAKRAEPTKRARSART